jgi:hypothetical protein
MSIFFVDISARILAQAGIWPLTGRTGTIFLGSDPVDEIIVEENSQRLITCFDRPQRI